jgi:hypothetical protein
MARTRLKIQELTFALVQKSGKSAQRVRGLLKPRYPHPPGILHEYQNKGVAAKASCMNMKTKGEYFANIGEDCR